MDTATRHNRWFVFAVLGAVVATAGLIPIPYLASPRWEVWVVDDDTKPVAAVNVRVSYQNYSAEDRSHELLTQTDANGYASFPAQYQRASLWQRIYYTVRAARALVHASFGRHAFVYALGTGFGISHAIDNTVDYWEGKSDTMRTRLMLKRTEQ